MSDFIRRPLEGLMGLVQGDIDEAFSKQRADIDSYTPGLASDWAAPAPTTVTDAIDRIVRAFVDGGGATP